MLQRFKHITTTKKRLKDGTVRAHYYHRRTGKKIEDEPGTPEFAESYARASKHDGNRAPPGTIHALVEAYFLSSKFKNLSPATQIGYRKRSMDVLNRFGLAPIPVFEDARIRRDLHDWRDEIARRSPRTADYAVAFLRRVLSCAYDEGQISVNHARNLGQVYDSNRTDNIWEDAEIEAFLRHASQEMALVLRLALDTAQRQSDLIRLTWTKFDGAGINLRQKKSSKPISVPCTDLLRAQLTATGAVPSRF